MFSAIKIRTRLYLMVGLLLTMALVLVGMGMFSLHSANGSIECLYKDRIVSLRRLQMISERFSFQVGGVADKVDRGDITPEEGKKTVDVALGQIKEQWDGYLATHLGRDEKKLVEETRPLMEAAEKTVEQLGVILQKKDKQVLDGFVVSQLNPSVAPVMEKLGALAAIQLKVAEQTFDGSQYRYNAIRIITGVGIALWILLSAGLSAWILRSVTGPLKDAITTINKISKGDLTARIDIASADEIGRMGIEINKLAETLRDTIIKVAESSTQVSDAATLLDGAAREMKGDVEKTVMQVESVATSSEEMYATSSEIAQNCIGVAQGSKDANESAVAGENTVQETLAVMKRIQGRVEESAMIMNDLREKSMRIGEVVDLISEVADQTNLLALNAAIEAARAGEHGRGFAVVADEVKKLAERTTRATGEIGETIAVLGLRTNDAVTSMRQGVAEVEDGVARAAQSGDMLRNILGRVEAVSAEINQVAVAAEQQTATTNEIAVNIQEIATVMNQTSGRIEENSQAAGRLAALSLELRGLVGEFQV